MQKTRTTRPNSTYVTEDIEAPAATDLLDDIDDLLEGIDEALGDNLLFAEEFVRRFVQKGGQ